MGRLGVPSNDSQCPLKGRDRLKKNLEIENAPPPLLMAQISRHFFTPLFFFAIESYIYETDFTLPKNITFKSSYNWFKIDIHQQLGPLTANYLAMFKVISTTIYT